MFFSNEEIELKSFLGKKVRCIGLQEDLSTFLSLDNQRVHGFSLGCLDAYFQINREIENHNAYLINGRILFLPKKRKAFVYLPEEDEELLAGLRKKAIVYSLTSLQNLKGGNSFYEIAYDLEKVFDPTSYPNKKKRYNRITYPFRWIEKNGIAISEKLDSKEVEDLHSAWVEHKLDDPKTYRIMFPTARYLNCFKRSIVNQEKTLVPVKYHCYGFSLENSLLSVRILCIQNGVAYDLANFTNTWSGPSQLSNYVDIWVLKDLYCNKGVKVLNCGAELNKQLRVFKEHYPHFRVESYMYSKVKV